MVLRMQMYVTSHVESRHTHKSIAQLSNPTKIKNGLSIQNTIFSVIEDYILVDIIKYLCKMRLIFNLVIGTPV